MHKFSKICTTWLQVPSLYNLYDYTLDNTNKGCNIGAYGFFQTMQKKKRKKKEAKLTNKYKIVHAEYFLIDLIRKRKKDYQASQWIMQTDLLCTN